MDQVLKKAGRIPEQILGKVSIAVSVCLAPKGWEGPCSCLSLEMPGPGSHCFRTEGYGREKYHWICFKKQSLYVLLCGSSATTQLERAMCSVVLSFDFLLLYRMMFLDWNRINTLLKNFKCYVFISVVHQALNAKLPVRGWLRYNPELEVQIKRKY